jgi:perosamine synthetase
MIRLAAPIIEDGEIEAVTRVLRSGGLAQGPEVKQFEEEFSKIHEDRPAVAVNSGTSALHVALLALGIGPGMEVLVPSFTFAATANAVRLCGATPVFVDIDPSTFCIDVTKLSEVLTPRTAAIIPVHLYGHPASMDEISKFAMQNNLLIVEDAAQAHLASLDSRLCGTWGDAACFSFYPTKNMTSGEGGMILFKDEVAARTARLLRNQGMEARYQNEIIGFNLRMTDIAAAIGREQLKKLPRWTETRRQNATFLNERIHGPVKPSAPFNVAHSYHQYTIRVDQPIRDDFITGLKENGIDSGIYYPIPVHELPAFGRCSECLSSNSNCLRLPETYKAASECVSLPVHPSLSESDLLHIAETVSRLFEGLSK